jgi:hypothetical protein
MPDVNGGKCNPLSRRALKTKEIKTTVARKKLREHNIFEGDDVEKRIEGYRKSGVGRLCLCR